MKYQQSKEAEYQQSKEAKLLFGTEDGFAAKYPLLWLALGAVVVVALLWISKVVA